MLVCIYKYTNTGALKVAMLDQDNNCFKMVVKFK